MTAPLPEDDVAMMKAIGLGDRQAFEQLYRQTSPRLYAVALRILRRQSWAEEVLHESFISVWNRASSYDPQLSSPLTWLTHIVRNRAIDWLRGSSGKAAEREDEWGDLDGTSLIEPVEELQRSQEGQKLTACLDNLPVDQRQSIVLAYYQGMSHGEVSIYLQQPLGTVKSWIRRALDHLKDCVGL
ncbi:Sigma-K factor [Serratia quinivorans]|jgi:RNA polymerase sigma-70 factor (ECF subfamily)|uniref:RNA polymerase sigma factor n=1 Tax=Serratia quinivorans TaxID=137545 RepID=UPI00217A9C31|nr:sigma-70 family RNA polymerase sigma factor [Serratia quinivorans]CAI0726426.1 Sigma-K factor [Serratia quinivorans]CAI0980272.1 Sigma-K factor [Serratia quinivorans]CAI1191122.1 Sigma-K factor [Serratia quinivorans]CAI1549566.1 Sigma-K factor [Serratia quinivorans]CAI1650187.1 Sigma-K factor [Serratia quinivorans]